MNLYVRLPRHHRYFLDNSSEGSFTNITQKEARDLLDTAADNIAAWDLDKGNKSHFEYEYEYECVENFPTIILFEEVKNRFGDANLRQRNIVNADNTLEKGNMKGQQAQNLTRKLENPSVKAEKAIR
jgi:hypothetical protein